MFKTHDVMGLIEDGITSIDGVISDKLDQYGCKDLYNVETKISNNVMIADFITTRGDEEKHDMYKITIELI